MQLTLRSNLVWEEPMPLVALLGSQSRVIFRRIEIRDGGDSSDEEFAHIGRVFSQQPIQTAADGNAIDLPGEAQRSSRPCSRYSIIRPLPRERSLCGREMFRWRRLFVARADSS